MKSLYSLSLAFGLISLAHAQEPDQDSTPDMEQIQRAIDEFNRSRSEETNEVTVVLPPPDEPAPPETTDSEEDKENDDALEAKHEEAADPKKPVLVSGKPPGTQTEETKPDENPELASEEEPETSQPDEEIVIENTPKPLTVRVESIRSGTGKIDPNLVQIKSNFPTKALTPPPTGWKLQSSDKAPTFKREVELKPGTTITLDITPHILSPSADGANTFSVTEPGYDGQKGYQQDQTVSNILESSIDQLETDGLKMSHALSELHRLLASLPKPETPVSNNPPEQP